MSCCCLDPYALMFDKEKADQDMKDYHETGIKKSSRPLFSLINDLPLKGKSLLDIGGGIGAISFELFKKDLKNSTHNDISKAYLSAFSNEVEKQELDNRVKVIPGDFSQMHEAFEMADIVSLDKVICCYPDFHTLVSRSVAKAGRWYVYNVPRNKWWVRLGMWLDMHWTKYKTGKSFKSYVHPIAEINELIRNAGFDKVGQAYEREWTAVLFEKKSVSDS